jgi:hypothetical protein
LRRVVTTVQPSSLGTIAIGITGEQSPNDDSLSRKSQIRSVLEILVLANENPSQNAEVCTRYPRRCNRDRDLT